MNYDFDSMLLQTIGSIISMRSVAPITDFVNEEGFSPLIASYTLPSFSIIETHQRRDFIRRCGTARNFFIEYPIQFSYSDECINFLISRENLISPKLAGFYNRFILFSFLSWIQNYLESENDDYILHVMKSLLIYHGSPNIDCFFSLYYICIQNRPITLFQSLYPLINLVFNEIKDIPLPQYAYSFLAFHFAKLFRNEEKNLKSKNDQKDDQTATENEEHFSQNAETMMNFVILLLIDQTSQITSQVALEFYDTIKSIVIEKIELRGMTFFANLSGFLPYETKFEAISEFPNKIIQNIEKNSEPYLKPPSEKVEVKKYNLSSETNGHFSFTHELQSFPNGLGDKSNFLSSSLNPKKIKNEDMKIVHFPLVVFSNICDNVLVSLLSFISKSIGDKPEERENLLNAFLDTFYTLIDTRPIDQYSLSILASYLIFCQINESTKHLFDITPLILKYNVWSPEYTIFQTNLDSFEGLNALRQFSLDFTLNQKSSSINSFFKEVFNSPLITAEISERLLNLQLYSLLLNAIKDDNTLLKTVCYASCSFVQYVNNEFDKDLDIARYSLFRLLSKLLKEDVMIELLYNNTLFLSFFFSLLFEIPIQDYVLNEVKMYLIDGCEDYIYENFTESFSHLFEQSLQSFITSNEGQNLTVKIIQTLLEVFEFKPKFAKTFSFIIQPFFDAIEEFNSDHKEEKKEKTFEFFELVFKYFEFLGHEDISMSIIVFMKDLIVSKHLIDCDDGLFELIKNKMVKNDIIVQPLLAHLMVLCFWNEQYKQIVKLFTEYCQINSLNSVTLHEAEIDSFIVDELKSSTLTDEEITERLNLLEQISIVISSPIIVQNFISLLKGNTNYLYFLNKLIVLNYSIPIAILPFYVVIENEFKSSHVGSFSIVVWLYLESDKNDMTLFRINENDDIKIFIKGIKLFVNDAYIFDLPIKKWFFLGLSFNAKEKSIVGYVNMNVVKILLDQTEDVSLMIDWDNLHLKKYSIGDPESLTGRYGNFGFFPDLQKINVRYFVEAGPRNIASPQIPTIEYFTPRKISDIQAAFLKTAEISNFTEIFLQICKIELILPLFAQLDDDKDRLNQIFCVLRNSLLIDENQQKYFQEIEGFAVITHLLISTHFKGLTFDFYMKFFNLCQEIANENLRNDLIKDVLINFELWTRSPEFLQITNHWKTVLFAGFEFISQKLMEFHDLLFLMRIYLYYQPIETKYIRPEPIVQFDKISEIRANIIEIFLNQYINLITVFDLALLMYQFIDCKDTLQVHDLLLFFTHLVDNPNVALNEFMKNTELTLTLHILLATNDQLIVPTVLSIIHNFQRKNLFRSLTFNDQMNIFFHQLKYSQLSPSVIKKMIGLIQNDVPELFSICCYFSLMLEINGNEEKQNENSRLISSSLFSDIFETIEPLGSLDTNLMWAIWAVYGAISLDNMNILSFLAHCGDSKWIYLYALIDRICQVFNFKGDFWKQRFLNIIADIIEARDPTTYSQQQQQQQSQQGKIYPFMENFFELAAFFIFYRKQQLHNLALLKLYNKNCQEVFESTPINDTLQKYEIPYSSSNVSNAWYNFFTDKPWLVSPQEEKKEEEESKTKNKADTETVVNNDDLLEPKKLEEMKKELQSDEEIINKIKMHEKEIEKENQKEKSTENETSKLKDIWFDASEKTVDSCFYDDKYVFGIRLTEEGEWQDKELAEKIFRIMNKFSVKSHKNLLFLLDHFIKGEKSNITEDIAETIINKKLTTYPYELFRSIRLQSEKVLEKAKQYFSYTPEPLENYGINRLDEAKQTILNKIDNSSRNWRFLWSHMTIDHAPWDISRGSNVKHYQRDFTLNSFNCPWKTKINRKFDIHENASKMRDSGNFEEEKPKVRPMNLHPLSIIEDEMISRNKETLAVNDNDFIFSHICEVIKISKVVNTTFSMNSNFIKVHDRVYKMEDIKYVFWRRFKQYPTAIEIFFINGKTLFLNFPGLKGKAVAKQIASFSPKNAIYIQQTDFDVFFQQTKLTEKWKNREISNFEYLMELNIFGGRSFNDPSQYPFLPWILSNYSSDTIDLDDSANYRDLSKPVGALGKERLDELVQRLADLRYFNLKEFLYSSYASTPLSVFLFNLRVEPYTTQHILMQGGRFDTPLRQFFSVERTFESVVTQMNDYRELTPEFFYDNEFLVNINKFDLGYVTITVDEISNEYESIIADASNQQETAETINNQDKKETAETINDQDKKETAETINDKDKNETTEPINDKDKNETTEPINDKDKNEAIETINDQDKNEATDNVNNEVAADSNDDALDTQRSGSQESPLGSSSTKKMHRSFSRSGVPASPYKNSYSHSISNVDLPPWANNSAFDFIYTNRKALESDVVSASLHKWIDLIFGVNQRGEGAVANNNTYKEEMYDDIWERSKDSFEERRAEIETIIEQVGQIPPQLFKTPHPQRNLKTVDTGDIKNSTIETAFQPSKWRLNKIFTENLNVGILFSTIHSITNNIVQFKMITSSHQIEIVDVEYITSPLSNSADGQITVNVLSRSDLPNEASQDDASSFIEVDKNVVLFLANSSLDAFVINLDRSRIQRINERRQKITSLSASKPQKFGKRLKLNMFSLSFDDSRTNIYCEKQPPHSEKDHLKSGSLHNLGFNFGFSIPSSPDVNVIHNDQNTAVIMNDSSSYNRRSRSRVQRASSTRVFANIPENNVPLSSSSSTNVRNNDSQLTAANKNVKMEKSGSSFGILSSIFSFKSDDGNNSPIGNGYGEFKESNFVNESHSVSYQKVLQRDRYYGLKYSVPTYRKSILCSALSVTFGVSISGTDDGSLIVASIHDGSAIRAIKLDDNQIPHYLVVTPGWGFILVNSSKYINGRQKFFLSLYTINGDLIKSISVDFSIDKAISWTNEQGFDFVAILTKNRNKIIVFEAFYMDVNNSKNQVYKSEQKIASFEYLRKVGALFAVSISGTIVVIPYST